MLCASAIARHRDGISSGCCAAPTVTVMVDCPEPGAGIVCGLKPTVVPVGTPEADRLIALLNPPLTMVVMVDVP